MRPLAPSLPDYIGVTEVATRSFEQMRVEATMKGQPSLMLDAPEDMDIGAGLASQNRGWTPVHAHLAGFAACTAMTVAVVAHHQAFVHRGLATRIRSLIDIRGFMADFDRMPEFLRLDFDLVLDTEEPPGRIRTLAMETDTRCPLIGLFHRARVPLVLRWFRATDAVPVHAQETDMTERSASAELVVG